MSDYQLGPEVIRLWDRLEAMNTKNFHADWGDGSADVEVRAKEINFALDQIENGTAHNLTDEELKDL